MIPSKKTWVAFFVTAGSLLTLLIPGCSSPTVPAYDRSLLLAEVASMITNRYAAVSDASQELAVASESLCEAPSKDEVAQARKAFESVFLAWERTLAFRFGPADDQNFGPEMSFAPTEPQKIEDIIAGDDKLDADFVQSEGGATKGLFALEYLLFADSSTATASALSADERRCTYLTLLSEHVETTSQLLARAWDPEGGNYQGTLGTAGQSGNKTYPAELSAVSELLTALTASLDVVKAEKLGVPLGRMADPAPDAVESPYAHLSLDALLENLQGARDIWMGTEHDFDEYLRTRDSVLAKSVVKQFDVAKQAIEDIPAPLSTYVTEGDASAGNSAYEALGELERTLGTDVSATLAVSLGFTSNDGD